MCAERGCTLPARRVRPWDAGWRWALRDADGDSTAGMRFDGVELPCDKCAANASML
jgi:hypothetical protein